ncbi:MAG: Nucleotidyl transferase [Myxococcales bacterium]|nr:Nucleotidyl transferase [Myxococcales bacterium]
MSATARPRGMILAAGFGTRLGTLSDERPKPMLPVCDIPLIRYAVAQLRGHGIDEIAVNLHHRGDLIRAELGDGFHYSEESEILGTGGGLAKIADWLTRGGRDPFVVVNGKIISNIDIGSVVARHQASGAVATMVLREVPDAEKWGAIHVGDDGRVTRIVGQGLVAPGQPATHACMFTGVHVLSPRLIARLPATGESDSIRQAYIPALLDGERIEGVRYDGYWHEHSTPERYLSGNWNLLSGAVTLAHPPGPIRAVAPSATVEAGATLGPEVVVGARSVVRKGARLDRVVVWPDCTVDGTLSDAIVTPKGIVTAVPAGPARR